MARIFSDADFADAPKGRVFSDADFDSTSTSPEAGLLDAAVTTNLEGASKLDPLAQIARLGQFANRGNQQLASNIAEWSGETGVRATAEGHPGWGAAIQYGGLGAAGALGTASEAMLPQNRLSVAAPLVAKGLTSAIGYAANKVGPQVIRALSAVPEKSAKAVLKDPSILARAKTVSEAGEKYAASTGELKSGAEGARLALGRSYLSGEAAANKFDDIFGQLPEDDIATQTVLSLRQATMQAINDLPYNQRGLGRVLAKNIEKMDDILTKRLPEWPGAKTGYRESMIAEDFGSWLPQNKNLSPNVLRTTGALAAAVHGISEGKALPLLALPAISPKIWGAGITAAASAAPYAPATAGLAANYAASRQKPSYRVLPLSSYYGGATP